MPIEICQRNRVHVVSAGRTNKGKRKAFMERFYLSNIEAHLFELNQDLISTLERENLVRLR